MPLNRPLRVLFVNAPPWKVVEPWYDTPNFPRQALGYLAAMLRERGGCELAVIDAKLERIGFDEVVRRAVAFRPDVVALTAFTNEIKPAAHVAERIKKELPSAMTLIGGVHVTALPVPTMREFPAFDVGCVGEGEQTIVELCDAIREGRPLTGVAGLVLRDAGEIVRTPERSRILDQDTIPFPAYDLFPPAKEFWVMTQRGCPFTCKFCMNPNGRAPRQRTVANVLGELKMLLDAHRPEAIFFGDEIFTVDMERAHALLDGMIELGVPKRTKFWVEAHVNFVDEAMFAHLKRAGCFQCGLGIETGSSDMLQNLGKGTNLAMIEEAFEAARRAKLPVLSFFVIGQPGETVESIESTIRLAVRLNPAIPIFGIMVPYPGTEVARLAARGEGGYHLTTTDWDEFNKQVGGALEFAGLSRWQIEWFQLSGYVKVFLFNFRFISLAKFVWKYRVAGLGVVFKILRGLGAAVTGGSRRPQEDAATVLQAQGPATTLGDIADAAADWQRVQAANLKDAKRFGDPERMRVVTRKALKVLQANEAQPPAGGPTAVQRSSPAPPS